MRRWQHVAGVNALIAAADPDGFRGGRHCNRESHVHVRPYLCKGLSHHQARRSTPGRGERQFLDGQLPGNTIPESIREPLPRPDNGWLPEAVRQRCCAGSSIGTDCRTCVNAFVAHSVSGGVPVP